VDRLLNESFEDDEETLLSNGWYYNGSGGDAGVLDLGSDAVAGDRAAYIQGNAGSGDRAVESNYTVNTSTYDSLTLTYVVQEDPSGTDDADEPGSGSWGPGENLYVQYHASDGSWVTVDNVSSQRDTEPAYYHRKVSLDGVANASHDNFELRFVQRETTNFDQWQVDAIDLVGVNESEESDLNGEPVAAFRYDPDSPNTGETVTFYGNRSDDPENDALTYQWDFGDGTTGSGENPMHSYSSGGTYTTTLTVTDADSETATTSQGISVTASNGFSSTTATAILPSTSGQNQSFIFSPEGSDIPSGTTITVNLDQPQQTSPTQVDYQGSNVETNFSKQNEDITKNPDTAEISVTTNETIATTEGARISINKVKTAPTNQQSDPYDVDITRGDTSDTATPTFTVARSGGNSELTNFDVSDLSTNTNDQQQTFVFETTSRLGHGESVSIDLSDAASASEVDYTAPGTLSANVSSSDLSLTDQTTDNASIRYSAPTGGLSANTAVKITLTEVDTGSMSAAPYDVGFSRGDAGTASTTFGVYTPGAGVTFTDGNTLKSFDGSRVTDYGVSADAVGPKTHDFGTNGEDDIPYVDVNSLDLIDSGTSTTGLESSENPRNGIAVGTFDGDSASGTQIYYAGTNSKIFRSDGTANSGVEVADPDSNQNKGATSIAGTGDIDGDDDTELVYYGNNYGGPLYLDPDNSGFTIEKTGYTSVGTNSGYGIGGPADFNGSGTARIPVVDGSNEIRLVEDDGDTTTILSDGSAEKAAIATRDIDSDSNLEIVYADASSHELYKLEDDNNDDSWSKSQLTDADGNAITVDPPPGVG